MKKALVDTNIVSAFMRGNQQVVEKVEQYLQEHDTLTVSVITYYELMRVYKSLGQRKKDRAFSRIHGDGLYPAF